MSVQDIQNLWDESGGDDLTQGKTFQQIYNSSPNKNDAFILQDYDLRCIDEGTVGGIHLAASGILYPKTSEDFEGKISGIYTHSGCGAAKIYVDQSRIETENPDLISETKAKELAEKMNIPYLGKIESFDMKRPQGFHIARVIYYDGTGHFNPTQASGLRIGFVISRKYISDLDYAKSEVEIAIKIAQGDHGFGKKFTPSSPLYLVAVSDDKPGSVSFSQLKAELQEITSKFSNIKIDTIEGKSDG